MPLVFADQGSPWTFLDRLLGQRLLVGGNRVGLHHRIVLVIEVEDIRRDSQAHRVALTPVVVDYHPHDALLERGFQFGMPTIRPVPDASGRTVAGPSD